MKICITRSLNPKIIGITNALNALMVNTNMVFWDSNIPLMKMMNDVSPDILFFTNKDLTPNHLEYCRKSFPNTKFVLIDQNNNEYDVDLKISLINKLDEKYLDFLADNILYNNGEYKEKFKSDFCIMSNQSMSENKLLMRWINTIGENFNIKIFGHPVNSAYYLGNIQLEHIKHIIASSKGIIMCDTEWYNNAIANNRIPICFWGKSINPKYTFNTYEELHNLCNNIVQNKIRISQEDIDPTKTYLYFVEKIIRELSL